MRYPDLPLLFNLKDNELKDLYMSLEDIIQANRDSMGSQIGTF